jgi:hypothetical protein
MSYFTDKNVKKCEEKLKNLLTNGYVVLIIVKVRKCWIMFARMIA